jgi:hypothetical protein
VPPSLDLRFAESKSLVDAVSGQQLITFTRASDGAVVNSAGQIEIVAANVPRFDHNPVTLESLGLLVEEQRTNLLLNSATLSTQTVTVTAVAHTLSFYGTGTVTLSGTSTAGPLVGTAANSRVSLTFTPTAGSLTLTVSGSVTNANLEIGSFPTSWIPTTGTAATRTADVVSCSGTNFSSWYNQAQGTVFASYSQYAAGGTVAHINDGTTANFINVFTSAAANAKGSCNVFVSNANNGRLDSGGTFVANAVGSAAYAVTTSDRSFVYTGGSVSTSASPTAMPVVNRLNIGSDPGSGTLNNGHIRRLTYWPTRLPNSTLQSITL